MKGRGANRAGGVRGEAAGERTHPETQRPRAARMPHPAGRGALEPGGPGRRGRGGAAELSPPRGVVPGPDRAGRRV